MVGHLLQGWGGEEKEEAVELRGEWKKRNSELCRWKEVLQSTSDDPTLCFRDTNTHTEAHVALQVPLSVLIYSARFASPVAPDAGQHAAARHPTAISVGAPPPARDHQQQDAS